MQIDNLWRRTFRKVRFNRRFWLDYTPLDGYTEITIFGVRLCWFEARS